MEENYAFLGIFERQIVFWADNRLIQLRANRSLKVKNMPYKILVAGIWIFYSKLNMMLLTRAGC